MHKQGYGTFRNSAKIKNGVLNQPLGSMEDIVQYASDTQVTFRRSKLFEVQSNLESEAGVNLEGHWLILHGVRSRTGSQKPIAFAEARIHPKLSEIARQLDYFSQAVFGQLESHAGLKLFNVTQDIKATLACDCIAAQLDIEKNDPVLRILRCYFDDGDLFEISVNYHPGNRFAYTMRMDAS